MPRLADVPADAIAAALRGEGLSLDFGAARARIRSDVEELVPVVRRVYGEFEFGPVASFHDIAVDLRRRAGLRRLVAPQIELLADADALFEPFPADTHLPLLEWGMNFLLAQRLNHRLLLHAGVVETMGRAVVMPALPGSGKSTLAAALALSGFRLLSDEFGVVGLDDGVLHPMVRPAGLKNDAIDAIERLAPRAVVGPRFHGTRKGTVAHLAPDASSHEGRSTPAVPTLVLFPRFVPGSPTRSVPMPRGRAFAKLAVNSFNYEVLGPDGFEAVGRLLRRCTVWRLTYGDLGEAVAEVERLVRLPPGEEGP